MAQLYAAFVVAVACLEYFPEQAVGRADDSPGILGGGIQLDAGRRLVLRLVRVKRVGPDKYCDASGQRLLSSELSSSPAAKLSQGGGQFGVLR